MKNFIAKALIRSHFAGKSIEFKKTSKGTVRYTVDGFRGQGFYRVRTRKTRQLELIRGKTFSVLHFGKFTFGFEHGTVRDAGNFSSGAR